MPSHTAMTWFSGCQFECKHPSVFSTLQDAGALAPFAPTPEPQCLSPNAAAPEVLVRKRTGRAIVQFVSICCAVIDASGPDGFQESAKFILQW
jgi:hypothetical protein